MIDIQNGIIPETIPEDIQHASNDEIGMYEEERRLFYVGITRAKNNLFLFRTPEPSLFIKQLFYKQHVEQNAKQQAVSEAIKAIKKVSPVVNKPVFNEAEYNAFVDNLAEGLIVTHKKYGEGVITAIDDSNVTILFDDVEKIFNMKILFGNKLIIIC